MPKSQDFQQLELPHPFETWHAITFNSKVQFTKLSNSTYNHNRKVRMSIYTDDFFVVIFLLS